MRLLRSDILISPLQDKPGCELFDNREGKSYEFGENEHYLIEQLQSPYHIDEITARYRKRFTHEISEEDIKDFLELLEKWQLLCDEEEDSLPLLKEGIVDAEERSHDINSEDKSFQNQEMQQPNLWHLFNPQALFDFLNGLLIPVRKIIWLTPFIFFVGCIAVMSNLDAFLADLSTAVSRFGVFGRVLFAAATVNLISQVLRGLVARYYHLTTPSIGLRLIFGLIPRFNVQILPPDRKLSRAARLWLNSISTTIRLLLFGFAILLWVTTRSSGSFLSLVGVELALLSIVSLLLVANPLWRGDGINFLSVWLEIPNLRERSKRAMVGLFFNQPYSIVRHTKHRIALGLFGLASFTFLVIFVSFISYQIFDTLEKRYQGAGVALFLFLAAYVSWNIQRQNQAKKTTQRSKSPSGQRISQDPGENIRLHQSSKMSSIQERMPKKSSLKKKGALLARKIALLAVFIMLMVIPYRYETGGAAEVFPIAKASVSSEASGIIDQIYVTGGQWVETGAKLGRISHYRQLKDVAVTEAIIQSKRFEIQQLLTTPLPEQVNLAKAVLESAELLYKYSTEELERITPLYENGVITLSDYEIARKDNDLRRQDVQEAQLSLEAILKQINPNQIEALNAEIERLEHEVKFYNEELQKTYLISPIDGQIVGENLHFKKHSYIEIGTAFVDIENNRTVSVRIAIPESDIGVAKLGAAVNLKLWAYSNKTFSGTVDEIEPSTATEEGQYGKVIYVRTVMSNPDEVLISGLTGYAKVTGEETLLILAFSRAFMRFLRIEVWSWLP